MQPPGIEYGPKTIDDFDVLPEDSTRRHELIDGRILVSPRPTVLHQDVMAELLVALFEALPRDYRVATEVEISFDDHRQCCVPDLAVTRPGVYRRRPRFESGDLAVAVEIVSGSGHRDREDKRRIYAAGGIPAYWRVELHPFRVVVDRLDGGSYETAEIVTGDSLVVTEPFEATIELGAVRRAAA